jgi:hypothetical protein
VESADVFPHDALEHVMDEKKFDFRPYFFDEGDYQITLLTPIFIYRLRTGIKNDDDKRQAKHEDRPIQPSPDVTEIWGLKNWAPYLGEYTPVIEIMATSHMQETKKSLLDPPDAISPSCGQVTLELHSLKNPDKATVKTLDAKSVERIWADFEPYRKALGGTSSKGQ